MIGFQDYPKISPVWGLKFSLFLLEPFAGQPAGTPCALYKRKQLAKI